MADRHDSTPRPQGDGLPPSPLPIAPHPDAALIDAAPAPSLEDALRNAGRALLDIDAAPAMINDTLEMYPDRVLDERQVEGLTDRLAFISAALANGLAVLERALDDASRAAHHRETCGGKPRQRFSAWMEGGR